jgi:hypothetical protein
MIYREFSNGGEGDVGIGRNKGDDEGIIAIGV